MACKSISSESGVLARLSGIVPRNKRLRFLSLAITFLLWVTIFARADIVSGRVFDPDGNLLQNVTFYVYEDEQARDRVAEFTTDESGHFSVYLDQGTYLVRSADERFEGEVHGYPQSTSEEDIHLHLRRR